jgi:hypothetical protein
MLTAIAARTLCFTALSLLLTAPGQAQKIEVGTGIFCDTERQVERFVALYDGDAEAAIRAVNREANDPTACGIATIAYVRSPDKSTTRTRSGTFNIVRVVVVAVLTQAGFQAAAPTTFYSVEKVDERIA